MTSKKILVFFVALLALAVFAIANVSASKIVKITGIEVNDIDVFAAQPVAVEAGETLSVRVFFTANETVEDVRVKVQIAGDPDVAAVTKELAVIKGNTYSKVLTVKLPATLDEEDLDEDLDLFVTVESREIGIADSFGVDLTLQRESNAIEILDVDLETEVNAGDVLSLDVVVKNRGRQTAEDNFVVTRIPALKLEDKAYFGDLTSMDQDDPDKEDSNERRLFLRIPSNTPAGVYVVEIEAFNDEDSATVTKKVVIKGAEGRTQVVTPIRSKSLKTGESVEYTLVLVNSGNKLEVFDLVIDSPSGLTIDVSEPVVAVPAGTSKTVKFEIKADKAGTYNFAVNVHSGGELVTKEEFTAKVEGISTGVTQAASPTVLLTVVLAVIFVVLLIVLIVLLTRRPEKTEEFGESYY